MEFPSPLGVIFSLIYPKNSTFVFSEEVSVSSRSYILSYVLLLVRKEAGMNNKFPSPLGVIFSLIGRSGDICRCINYSFRLLSELYSLLLDGSTVGRKYNFKLGFRLLSELYSLLCKK